MNKLSNIVNGSNILTSNGYHNIENILGEQTLWNGTQWIKVYISKNKIENNSAPVKKRTYYQDIILVNNKEQKPDITMFYNIIFSDGTNVICHNSQQLCIVTNIHSNLHSFIPIHELYNYKINKILNSILTKDVTHLYLSNCEFPFIEGDIKYDLKYPYLLGYMCGYIYNINNNNNNHMNENDINELLSKVQMKDINQNHLLMLLKVYQNDIIVPINATLQTRLDWLAGIIELNSHTTKLKDATYLNIKLNSKNIITNIKYLCNTLQMNPRILEIEETRRITNHLLIAIEQKKHYYILKFNANDTNKIFLEYNIQTYIFQYDKSLYSIDQDIIKYISIKKIIPLDNKNFETYNIQNTYSCIINGALI